MRRIAVVKSRGLLGDDAENFGLVSVREHREEQ
jgi:hypothetical protein